MIIDHSEQDSLAPVPENNNPTRDNFDSFALLPSQAWSFDSFDLERDVDAVKTNHGNLIFPPNANALPPVVPGAKLLATRALQRGRIIPPQIPREDLERIKKLDVMAVNRRNEILNSVSQDSTNLKFDRALLPPRNRIRTTSDLNENSFPDSSKMFPRLKSIQKMRDMYNRELATSRCSTVDRMETDDMSDISELYVMSASVTYDWDDDDDGHGTLDAPKSNYYHLNAALNEVLLPSSSASPPPTEGSKLVASRAVIDRPSLIRYDSADHILEHSGSTSPNNSLSSPTGARSPKSVRGGGSPASGGGSVRDGMSPTERVLRYCGSGTRLVANRAVVQGKSLPRFNKEEMVRMQQVERELLCEGFGAIGRKEGKGKSRSGSCELEPVKLSSDLARRQGHMRAISSSDDNKELARRSLLTCHRLDGAYIAIEQELSLLSGEDNNSSTSTSPSASSAKNYFYVERTPSLSGRHTPRQSRLSTVPEDVVAAAAAALAAASVDDGDMEEGEGVGVGGSSLATSHDHEGSTVTSGTAALGGGGDGSIASGGGGGGNDAPIA